MHIFLSATTHINHQRYHASFKGWIQYNNKISKKSYPHGILSLKSYILKLAENYRWTKSCQTKNISYKSKITSICIKKMLSNIRRLYVLYIWEYANDLDNFNFCHLVFNVTRTCFVAFLFRSQSTLTLFIADVIFVYWNREQWTILIDKKCRCCKNKDVFRSKT